jgi:CubicO group peptidase (beta-lactamase class C family)
MRRILGIGVPVLVLGAWAWLTIWMGAVLVGVLRDRAGAFDPTVLGAAYHRVALRSMSELFPTRTVSRGGRISEQPAAPVDLDGVALTVSDETLRFDDFLERNHTHGIVVLHRGRRVYERYFEGADERSRFTSWSVAKSFTATLVGMALGEGRIASLDDPLEQYVESLRGTAYEGVTIDQALRMSSGVAFTEVYTAGGSDVSRFMGQSAIGHSVPADELAASFPRGAAPGSVFNYNTAETQILGMLVRAVYGRGHAEVLEEALWRPLGMENDASLILDRPGAAGIAMAGCCLNAALRDWARFGQLHLQDGIWEGRRLLPEGWVADATTLSNTSPDDEPSSKSGYRYQWWVFDEGRYAAEGVHGQFILVDPARRLVVAKASFWPVAWDDALAAEALAAFAAIGDYLER